MGFNGSQGPAGPAGSTGPPGPKGSGNFSSCQYKVEAVTLTAGDSITIAALSEPNVSMLTGTSPLRIMFTVGSVGQHYRSIYRPILAEYRSTLSPVDTRPGVGRVSVEHRPIYRRMFVSTDTVLVSSTLGRYLIDTLPIVC